MKKGFTLIELLVVIAIIGILASIVLVSLNGARQSARDTKRISDMRSATLALELYFADNAEYPAPAVASTCENFSANLDTALGDVFDDPSSGASYMYGADSASSAQDFVILATLENSGHDVLTSANDVDGVAVLGCDCTDPAYCLQP